MYHSICTEIAAFCCDSLYIDILYDFQGWQWDLSLNVVLIFISFSPSLRSLFDVHNGIFSSSPFPSFWSVPVNCIIIKCYFEALQWANHRTFQIIVITLCFKDWIALCICSMTHAYSCAVPCSLPGQASLPCAGLWRPLKPQTTAGGTDAFKPAILRCPATVEFMWNGLRLLICTYGDTKSSYLLLCIAIPSVECHVCYWPFLTSQV